MGSNAWSDRIQRENKQWRPHEPHCLRTHLKLPVGRLEELLCLIGGAASRQNKLVDHDLMSQFVHIHRHGHFPHNARLRQCRKRKKKLNCRFGRHLRTFPTQSSLSVSIPWVPSAAFSNNNNIFMSSPITKRRTWLIGRGPSELILQERSLAVSGKGLNAVVRWFWFSRTPAMSGVKPKPHCLMTSPPPVVLPEIGHAHRFMSVKVTQRIISCFFYRIFSRIPAADWPFRLAGI